MRLVLAEKPSVALDIAKALGARREGAFFRGEGLVVAYARGHLYEVDEALAPKEWTLEGLPVLPAAFRYRPRPGAGELLRELGRLLRQAEEVVIATDAGREGELIARLILEGLGWRRWDKTYRLWTSEALTPGVVRREMSRLKEASRYDSLYESALARLHADWVVGINYTRLVTLKAREGGGGGVWSVGRVQTPTLRLVVEREEEIGAFRPEPYAEVWATFLAGEGFRYEGVLFLPEGSRLPPERGEALRGLLAVARRGRVEGVEREERALPPPLLHSLTTLQRQANALYGFTAKKTLDLAQRLYEERKAISYPRTESRHLPESARGLVREVLEALGRSDLLPGVERAGKRVFDDSKLTDHHAIIPLAPLPPGASKDEERVYGLVARRFFAAFSEPALVERTEVRTGVEGFAFRSRFRAVKRQGWLLEERPEGERGGEGGEEERALEGAVPLEEGQEVEVAEVAVRHKTTTPPPRYTEGTLLREMERLGLGTPATRAGIIETLKERGYVRAEGKSLLPTEKGKTLVSFLRPYPVASPETTATWERLLEAIWRERRGREGYREFMEGIYAAVRQEVGDILARGMGEIRKEATPKMLAYAKDLARKTGRKLEATSFEEVKAFIDEAQALVRGGEALFPCACGAPVRPFSKGWKCEAGHVVWEEAYGRRLTVEQARRLFAGERLFLKFKSKRTGKPFEAHLYLDREENKLKLDFPR